MSDHDDAARAGAADASVRAFPVSSGWNAFDVWWTRVRWVAPTLEDQPDPSGRLPQIGPHGEARARECAPDTGE